MVLNVKIYPSVGFRFVDDLFNLDGTFFKFLRFEKWKRDTHFFKEYSSLRTAIMKRINKVNIHIPKLYRLKEYGPIIPNNISLF